MQYNNQKYEEFSSAFNIIFTTTINILLLSITIIAIISSMIF